MVKATKQNPQGIWTEMIFLIFDAFLYAVLLYVVERKVLVRYKWKRNRDAVQESTASHDVPDNVLQEWKKVENLLKAEGKSLTFESGT